MGAARSDLIPDVSRRRPRRWKMLAAAASAIALLGACETAPTPEEIAQMDWQSAARVDTPPAYGEYMRVHPDGEFINIARIRIAELEVIEADNYAIAKRADTEDAYVGYLARFPWGANAASADARRAVLAAPRLAAEEKRDWDETRKSGLIEVYEDFLEDWPRGAHAVEARAKLDALWRTDQGDYVKAKRSGAPAELRAFIVAWPRSEYVADARREIDAMDRRDDDAWRRAMAENSTSAYDFYLQSQPYGEWRVEAARAIEDLRARDYEAWRYAAALDQVWAYENYRNQYPWGTWYDTAFYRIDWIHGGRDWNRWNNHWNHGWNGWNRDHDRDRNNDRDNNTYTPLFKDNNKNNTPNNNPNNNNTPPLFRGQQQPAQSLPVPAPSQSQRSGNRFQPQGPVVTTTTTTPPPAPPPPPPPPSLFGDKQVE